MKIETKFNLNDNAWYMRDNKPVQVIISAIETFHVGTNQGAIKYNGKNVINSQSWLDHTNLHESFLYKTKGDLLEALFGDEECKGIDLGDGNFSGCDQSAGDCPSCGK